MTTTETVASTYWLLDRHYFGSWVPDATIPGVTGDPIRYGIADTKVPVGQTAMRGVRSEDCPK